MRGSKVDQFRIYVYDYSFKQIFPQKPIESILAGIRENTYVRINGHLRSFNGKRNVVAFNVQPVTNVNEFSCHLAEVVTGNMLVVKSQVSISYIFSTLCNAEYTRSRTLIMLARVECLGCLLLGQ